MPVNRLIWRTIKKKVSDLIPFEKNPRRLTNERAKRLKVSLDKFNLAEIPIINQDGVLIGGNQRIKLLIELGRGDEKIDVRVPNRLLSELELKEYALLSNSHAGEWDFDLLESEFSDFDLTDFDIKIPEFESNHDYESPQRQEGSNVLQEEKKWFVYIDCVNEVEAEKMYTELSNRGFETKVVN